MQRPAVKQFTEFAIVLAIGAGVLLLMAIGVALATILWRHVGIEA